MAPHLSIGTLHFSPSSKDLVVMQFERFKLHMHLKLQPEYGDCDIIVVCSCKVFGRWKVVVDTFHMV